MSIGDRIKTARLASALTQRELAELSGISERSIYSYEQGTRMPKSSSISKLAQALNVGAGYILVGDTDNNVNDMQSGTSEAEMIIMRAGALFAGGELNDTEKEQFFRSLMQVYIDSKEEARKKYSVKK